MSAQPRTTPPSSRLPYHYHPRALLANSRTRSSSSALTPYKRTISILLDKIWKHEMLQLLKLFSETESGLNVIDDIVEKMTRQYGLWFSMVLESEGTSGNEVVMRGGTPSRFHKVLLKIFTPKSHNKVTPYTYTDTPSETPQPSSPDIPDHILEHIFKLELDLNKQEVTLDDLDEIIQERKRMVQLRLMLPVFDKTFRSYYSSEAQQEDSVKLECVMEESIQLLGLSSLPVTERRTIYDTISTLREENRQLQLKKNVARDKNSLLVLELVKFCKDFKVAIEHEFPGLKRIPEYHEHRTMIIFEAINTKNPRQKYEFRFDGLWWCNLRIDVREMKQIYPKHYDKIDLEDYEVIFTFSKLTAQLRWRRTSHDGWQEQMVEPELFSSSSNRSIRNTNYYRTLTSSARKLYQQSPDGSWRTQYRIPYRMEFRQFPYIKYILYVLLTNDWTATKKWNLAIDNLKLYQIWYNKYEDLKSKYSPIILGGGGKKSNAPGTVAKSKSCQTKKKKI